MGYVPGNVVVISHRANCIKYNATMQELCAVVSFYLRLSIAGNDNTKNK